MIKVYNRRTGKIEIEKVLGDRWIEFAYDSILGSFLTRTLLRRKFVSQILGSYQDTKASLKKIPGFIREYAIPMHEFVDKQYASFNDFFIRAFRPGVRSFSKSAEDFSAFAEGRYFVFDQISENTELPVKGALISLSELVGPSETTEPFIGGALFLARLCPVDYHRFHFPDSGKILRSYRIGGNFDSVNPAALKAAPRVLFENEREVTLLETQNFGRVLYIEVGALLVGRIVQSRSSEKTDFAKGDEKGFFLFGGSTVIVLTEKGRLTPSADLLSRTKIGIETLVPLGDTIGQKNI